MSALPVEASEPDPAATSTSNDETVSKETGDNSTPTDVEAVKTDPEVKPSNSASEVKSEKVEVKEEDVDVKTENSDNKNGATSNSKEVKSEDKEEKKPKQRTYENGMLKTSARIQDDRKSQSKYDASVLPETDDPSKIRAQVRSNKILAAHSTC
jgi:lupus La protein